jgi:hypothetical protein
MQPGFEQRAVGFLDVLGFKELIDGVENDPTKFGRLVALRTVVNAHVRWDNDTLDVAVPQSIQPRHLFVSDSIIISSRLEEGRYDGLAAVTVKSIEIAHKLFELGFLLRGAISVGPVLHEERNIFGSGYMKAYQTEMSVDQPRIVFAKEAQDHIKSARTKGSPIWDAPVAGQYEGIDLVETLNPTYLRGTKMHGRIEGAFSQYRAHIHLNLEKLGLGLRSRSKWEWMAGFFNRAIEKFGVGVQPFDVLPLPLSE